MICISLVFKQIQSYLNGVNAMGFGIGSAVSSACSAIGSSSNQVKEEDPTYKKILR